MGEFPQPCRRYVGKDVRRMEEKKSGLFTKIEKSSVTVLNAVLCGTVLLAILFRTHGLKLVSFSDAATYLVYTAFTIIMFVFAMKTNGYTSTAKSVSAAMLPLSSALFGVWSFLYFNGRVNDMIIPVLVLAALCITMAMVISVRHGKIPVLSSVLSVLGCIITALVMLLGALDMVCSTLFNDQLINEAQSPDGLYYAEAYLSDQGALGGETAVVVTKAEKAIPTPFGWICAVDSATVYLGEWYDPEKCDGSGIRLSWQDENTLLINGRPEEIDDYFD